MGMSIHMHIETKKNGQWHHFSAPALMRDSWFFALLRGQDMELAQNKGIKPVAPIKGLPDDLSFVTAFCHEQDKKSYKIHHESWLGADELVTLQERMDDIFKDKDPLERDLDYSYLHTYINGNSVASHQGWDDVRLIFWFDN